MVFIVEAIISCLIFTIIVCVSLLKDPLAWISDYPLAIQNKVMELGLISKDKPRFTNAELIRKIIGMLFIIILFIFVLIYINKANSFKEGFLLSYGLYSIVCWYDALLIDCLWFCHSKKVIIKGTEDLVDSYHDYWFHIKQSMIGMVLGLPVSLIVGLGVKLIGG